MSGGIERRDVGGSRGCVRASAAAHLDALEVATTPIQVVSLQRCDDGAVMSMLREVSESTPPQKDS
eukprot:6664784-Prymnesium_polylepis.1